ncbi:transcription factor hbp-1a-like [Stylonychia lemnae]|uniref:Transcription factor hbp-1a-like n=1 Tax=Stylonychia lemnae TaxID=5949 RepID=A0A077ZP98_STYLE|nr:transcription factor hbp-1a-like [Stylonychia lemnae]|eukprot:CDW71210.1 transcription factor hbp-1a-like [Stylonychia lemnae]
MRTQRNPKQNNISDQTIESQQQFDDSDTYSGILGKRVRNETSTDDLKAEIEGSVDNSEDAGLDSSERRERRLQQNRKSAKKCRLKKKEEFSNMKADVMALQEENKTLKDKINEITIMLYQKMEENTSLQRKLETAQTQQMMFITQMMSQSGASNQQAHSQQMGAMGLGLPAQQSAQSMSPGIQSLYQSIISQGGNSNSSSVMQNLTLQNTLMQLLNPQGQQMQSQATAHSDSTKSSMSSSSARDQNSSMGSPKGQILNGLNIPKGCINLGLGQKPVLPNIDEDNSRVNLLALLKQLNQRKSSEEAHNFNLLSNLVSKSERKISM